MDIQTTETITEITQRYELYKDIVKIGLGALIGASASIIAVLMKNKHELRRIEKEYDNQTNRHKLEIKVRILEEVIDLVNKFYIEDYNFRNKVYKMRYHDKYYKDLSEEDRNNFLLNVNEYVNALQGIENAKRKLDMINAEHISLTLDEFKTCINDNRNKILANKIKINFSDEDWETFVEPIVKKNTEFKKELNLFFLKLE